VVQAFAPNPLMLLMLEHESMVDDLNIYHEHVVRMVLFAGSRNRVATHGNGPGSWLCFFVRYGHFLSLARAFFFLHHHSWEPSFILRVWDGVPDRYLAWGLEGFSLGRL
jgi:hypothetical protein